MPVGYVTSDLHLFAQRSAASQFEAQLASAMSTADVFILNGDIFDFRWSTLGSAEKTAEAAVIWLRAHCTQFPHCTFHFVLGNHDSAPAFVKAAMQLSAEQSNFFVHPHFLILGDKLFVHGDAAAAKGDPELLLKYREKFADDKKRGAALHFLYQSAVVLRLHAIHPALLPKKKIAERLLWYFRAVAPESIDDVRHIYFGHTHGAFSDFCYKNWVFHNTGAMIHGVKHSLLEIQL